MGIFNEPEEDPFWQEPSDWEDETPDIIEDEEI